MYEVYISHQTNFNDNSTSLDQDEEWINFNDNFEGHKHEGECKI